MRIIVSIEGLDDLGKRFRDFTSEADQLIQEKMLDSAIENIVTVAKALAPKKTGALEASIEARLGEEPNQIEIVSDKFYAPFLEYGTKPHEIDASSARALHWAKDGQDFFAKSVQNPGTEEGKFSFIGPAIQEGLDKLAEDVKETIIS